MGKEEKSKMFLGRCCGTRTVLIILATAVLCSVLVVVVRSNNHKNDPPTVSNNSTTTSTIISGGGGGGIQEDCSDPMLRGPRCIQANLTAGECYDLPVVRGLADNDGNGTNTSTDVPADFFCVGEKVTYKNVSGVVSRESVQDILEQMLLDAPVLGAETTTNNSSYYYFSQNNNGKIRRDLVDFLSLDVGVAFVDIQFTAVQCRKTTMTWKHSIPRSTYLESYAFYDTEEYNGGTTAVSGRFATDEDHVGTDDDDDDDGRLTVNYYEKEYQDYIASSHRIMLLDSFAKDIAMDVRSFGACMDVWPDTTDCSYELIISSGGVSTEQWDADLWKGNHEWYASWPRPSLQPDLVAVQDGLLGGAAPTSYCKEHSASIYCSVSAAPSGVHTFAVIAPIYSVSSSVSGDENRDEDE